MSGLTVNDLERQYAQLFGEPAPAPAAKSFYIGDSVPVDLSRPANGLVWSKWGAATAAIRSPVIDSCISKRTTTIGGLKWEVIDNASGETIGSSDDYDSKEPVSALLHRYSRRNDGRSLFGQIEQHLSITGESYVELVRHPGDRFTITDIEFLNSLSVDPVSHNNTDIDEFHYRGAGQALRIRPADLIYHRYTSNLFTETGGYSPIMTLIGANNISIMDAAGRAMSAYFNNDGLPRGVITPKENQQPWLETEQAQIRNTLSRNKGAGYKY
jgi:phage portal protein BeeE